MKYNIKAGLRSVGFLLLALWMLNGLSWLLRDRGTTLACLYSEPPETLDVILVGSSHVNSGCIPSIFWQQGGIAACNVFSWSQPMWISYHYIKEALKTQSPRVVVLDLFGATYGHSSIMPQEIDKTSYANSFNIDPGLNFLQMIQTVERCGLELRSAEDFLNLPRYHTRWKQLSASMLTYNPHKDADPLKGYGLVLSAQPQEKPSFPNAEAMVPYETCVEYLDKIVALCEKEGIELVFTLTPYCFNEAEQGIFQWLDSYARQHGIPFLNYNGADGERIGINFSTDLADWGHLNFYGAQKISRDLCHFLKQNYVFPSREGHPNRAALDEDARYYQRTIDVQDILTEAEFDRWVQMALAEEEFLLFLTDTGAVPQASKTLSSLLGNAGFALPGCFETLALLRDGIHYDESAVQATLFGHPSSVEMDAHAGRIYLNGTAAPLGGEGITAVLYDTVLGKPLETVYLDSTGQFQHREFTSDIINSYRR